MVITRLCKKDVITKDLGTPCPSIHPYEISLHNVISLNLIKFFEGRRVERV